jgi:16S rRNA (guanine527-N7)-methyltransferase
VTLAESQGKKAAFLQEAVRVLGLSTKVHAQRAEALEEHFDCVTLRAVDRMAEAVDAAGRLLAPGGWLALMTTGRELTKLQAVAGAGISWTRVERPPDSDERVLALGQRSISSPA